MGLAGPVSPSIDLPLRPPPRANPPRHRSPSPARAPHPPLSRASSIELTRNRALSELSLLSPSSPFPSSDPPTSSDDDDDDDLGLVFRAPAPLPLPLPRSSSSSSPREIEISRSSRSSDDLGNGHFLLQSSKNILTPSALSECEEALNQGTTTATEVFMSLRTKSILHQFASIGRFLGLKGILSSQLSSLLFLVVGISMALTPWLAAGGQLLASRFEQLDVRSLLPDESEVLAKEVFISFGISNIWVVGCVSSMP